MTSGNTTRIPVMTMHDHIKELRNKLFLVAIFFLIFSTVAYVYRDILIGYLMAPLDGESLSYLNPGGGFSFIFKVTMWAGFATTLPFFAFSLYRFLLPVLPIRAHRNSLVIFVASLFLLICGAAFGYFYAIPGAMNFLLTFADEYVNPMLTADSYLNFILAYTVGLGLLFQLPLLMIILHWITPQKPTNLLKIERYVIVLAFILAAIITPTPDIVNQAIIAGPIILMYQIGFLAVWISIWRTNKQARRTQKASGESPIGLPDIRKVTPRRAMPHGDTPSMHVNLHAHRTQNRLVGDIITSSTIRRQPTPTQQVAPISRTSPAASHPMARRQPDPPYTRRSVDTVRPFRPTRLVGSV